MRLAAEIADSQGGSGGGCCIGSLLGLGDLGILGSLNDKGSTVAEERVGVGHSLHADDNPEDAKADCEARERVKVSSTGPSSEEEIRGDSRIQTSSKRTVAA